MPETISIYVKNCTNVPGGMPLTTFTLLSPIWTGPRLALPFGPNSERQTIVGWTDLFFGSPCSAHVARVRAPDGCMGYLIFGGNQGVRIFQAVPEDGYGWPIVWVTDITDLPPDVQAIVGQTYEH